eukprot:m.275281 g.275281  ORF g.275281 m.275281 type:complete len:69 (-) comp17692_c0_seq54:205-411(-)
MVLTTTTVLQTHHPRGQPELVLHVSDVFGYADHGEREADILSRQKGIKDGSDKLDCCTLTLIEAIELH